MSEEFTRITISGAFPLTPNRSYVRFTPEAVKNALAKMDGKPIVALDNEEKVVGCIDGDAYDIEESETEIGYKVNGLLFGNGKEIVINGMRHKIAPAVSQGRITGLSIVADGRTATHTRATRQPTISAPTAGREWRT